MGKSDIAFLPTNRLDMPEKDHPKLFSIGADEYHLKNPTTSPSRIELLSNQVAGHMNNKKTPGMLKYEGTILKPILKQVNGQTEIKFYEALAENKDGCFTDLKEFLPNYYGTKSVNFNNKDFKCIVLEDLTKNFKEPCIMDIKIGKRTWDPLASHEKMTSEDNKYQDTKRELGLCIPGFLVHRISNGRVCKFEKDYGKSLNSETIKDALKTFLNADMGLNRELLLQFLVDLWRILHWARKQRKIRLFSSSLLLIYDAKCLKQHVTNNNICNSIQKNNSMCSLTNSNRAHLYKPLSLLKLNGDCLCTGFSGQFTKEGPILRTPSMKLAKFVTAANENSNTNNPWQRRLTKLRRVHSFQNNYDKDLQKMKTDYTNMLDNLVDDDGSEIWATIRMIDFAHVFPAEHNEVDRNYLEGVENLVKIFEEFLSETVSD